MRYVVADPALDAEFKASLNRAEKIMEEARKLYHATIMDDFNLNVTPWRDQKPLPMGTCRFCNASIDIASYDFCPDCQSPLGFFYSMDVYSND